MSNLTTIRQQLSSPSIKGRFTQLLGQKKSEQFISNLLSVVTNNKLLQNSEPATVLNAAATAASLDLPINPNLGFAYIVPYKGQAQFQMGYKGLTQLAMRSGQYHRLNVVEVYESQFESYNTLTEDLNADFSIAPSGKVVGYVAYFKLVNGFEKLVYWSIEKVKAHGKKYSQSFNSKYSPWASEFDEMAKKTVLKNTLSKWGIMTVDLQTAQVADQSVQTEEGEYSYVDNEPLTSEEMDAKAEEKRAAKFIENAKTIEDLEIIEGDIPESQMELFNSKKEELSNV